MVYHLMDPAVEVRLSSSTALQGVLPASDMARSNLQQIGASTAPSTGPQAREQTFGQALDQ